MLLAACDPFSVLEKCSWSQEISCLPHFQKKREREGHLQSRCFWILYLLVDRGMPGKNNMTINDWKALIRRPNLECKGGGLKSSITPNRVPSFKATAFIPWQGKMHNVKVKRRAKKTPSIW